MGRIDFGAIKAIALDLDGVVYEGNHAIPGAAESIGSFSQLGLEVFPITNNSTRTREETQQKLKDFQIYLPISNIFTSSYVAAHFLRNHRNQGGSVLVIGENGLVQEILRQDLHVCQTPPAQTLVVGLDREFSYTKICNGLAVLQQGAFFLACNRDKHYPGEKGELKPGCGSMVAAIEAVASRKVDIEIGKPNPYMLRIIQGLGAYQPREILVIGDSVESDIAMANAFGCPSILLCRENIAHIAQVPDRVVPDYVMSTLVDVINLFHNSDN